MEIVETAVILQTVSEFDVNGQIAVFEQLQIQQQPSRAPVAVDKGMNAFKTQVQPGDSGNRVDLRQLFLIISQHPVHFFFDKMRRNRLVFRTEYVHGNAAVTAAVFRRPISTSA